VLTPPSSGEEGDAVIREDVHEILEIQPAIPKLHRLNGLLRGQEYDETVEQGNARMDVDGDAVRQPRRLDSRSVCSWLKFSTG
jgi:sister chromatid cohesion protein DCC1